MASPEVPPTTSASQLTTFAMCPRLYWFRYVAHAEPEFRSLNLVLGSAVHGAIGWWFEERLAGREPSLDGARRIVCADLHADTVEATIRWRKETAESLEAKARALVTTYLTEFGDQEVVAVEQRFDIDLFDPETGEVLPRPLVGYLDLVVADGDSIVEIKTTARAWSPLSLERHLQVGAYSAAALELHGEAKVAVHTVLKQKTPRVEVHEVERAEAENGWFAHAAAAIERAILAGHFPPAPGPTCFECEFGRACLNWGRSQPAHYRGRFPVAPTASQAVTHAL